MHGYGCGRAVFPLSHDGIHAAVRSAARSARVLRVVLEMKPELRAAGW